MTSLNDTITQQMKTAMLAKDALSLAALRALKSAIQNACIAKGSVHETLTPSEEQAVIRKQIKQREDAITLYQQAGRQELADKESAEIVCLSKFLPAELTEAELSSMLDAVIAELGASSKKDMGRVMKLMQERCEGRAAGKLLSQLVSSKLS